MRVLIDPQYITTLKDLPINEDDHHNQESQSTSGADLSVRKKFPFGNILCLLVIVMILIITIRIDQLV